MTSRFRNTLVIGAALAAGIACGHLLHASPREQRNGKENPPPLANEGRHTSFFRTTERPAEGSSATRAQTAIPFVVPRDAMSRIKLDLLDGTSLNHKECELLGLSESQIEEMDTVVSSAVTRWREREKATMKVVSSSSGNTLIHIPPADPAIAEKEWQDLKAGMLEIGGKDLEPLLRYRLTDGYSPTHQSNAMTGMLNVLTAGYGTLERMVSVRILNGHTTYEVLDILPDRRKGAAVDEAFFHEVKDSGSYGAFERFYDTVPEQLSHLLPSK